MVLVSEFRFFFFSYLVFLLSAVYANGKNDHCPRSFPCGKLGKIQFPLTKAERPDCGLLVVHGCDEPNPSSLKTIQLEKNGRQLLLTTVFQRENLIKVFDQDLHNHLKSNVCQVFNKNISLPQHSPLVSFHLRNNVTIYRCNHSLNISPPIGFINHTCPGYDIYYQGSDLPLTSQTQKKKNKGLPLNLEQAPIFSACSVLQLLEKDVTNTTNLLSFLTAQMLLEVRLSDECDKCYNHNRGQCRLDKNKKFFCDKGLSIGLLGILIIWLLLREHYKRNYASSNVQLQSKNNKAIDPYSNIDPESSGAYFGVPLFTIEELEEATNNFDRSRELGNGGFGTVYYGKLQDGREVAVKRLYEHNCRRLEQFMNEIVILTRLCHQNLVSLYGCTSRHSHKLLLVYEYIRNGTLSCHLHGELAHRCLLPWQIRIKIAIETATALAYLHASDTIHRDVKTNNILIDNNFCVKVADFGLSRLFPNDVTHVSTAPQGSPGYVDPEYHQCYQLTSKSDVYSFGVVLIELISSKAAVDMNRHKDEINLANLAIKKIQDSALGDLVDPSLGFESDNEVRRMIVSVAELAFRCLQRDKELRPSMDEVLMILKRIESGKEKVEHLEEVDIHGAGISLSGPIHPPSPDCNETGSLKNTKSPPSAETMTHKWSSELTTPNAST
ncbi:LEAF RUST 10 DISEASE-RESISTANCE LOCUS RECEPTOR-LIKE PROTEIN KINASE-like 1.1 [Senna tora]|uniref:LEAF RUST 10 DISEASE-RESISTANCE LOCUS RECEPTOR-LIKE PROTEIN KINASE-like 1.1 n=1 Tax=Senna tora TaxID=362788 RepID=A0A834TWR0_9FABA|nr:LEAF RUST 10 DISEASE-RESISTANCE LOCUS RECEPTOR-LIKE PROTEIN KINASE-like 1.1 [Senna tora]